MVCYTYNTMTEKYRLVFKNRLRSLIEGVILLFLALACQFWASSYSTRVAGQFVGDIVLDNTSVFHLNFIIVTGALISLVGVLILLLVKPKYLLFTLKAAAIFIAVRAFMISATHLGIYPDQLVPGTGFFDTIYKALDLQAGYFFSGHTGIPLLMAMIFWDEPIWRYIFLAAAAIFGASVLLAHVHYSIDVFAAPFMTFAIFEFCKYLFANDYELADS